MAKDPSQVVGERLRDARLARGWSTRDLAQAGAIALNTVSLIERGKVSPTVSTLQKLAAALEVPLSFFVEEHEGQRAVFLKPGERRQARGVGVILETLGAGLPGQTMEPLLLAIEPGASSGPDPIVHGGQELVFCLAGSIEYRVGDEVFAMGPEDSLFFAAGLPHGWRNVSQGVARLLLVVQSESRATAS
ncbi:MAG: XRE family transcriptional regulator [Chloroflexi bacterium]|nr:XRE family transcriptional regulator [Chloroflexota bacterium]